MSNTSTIDKVVVGGALIGGLLFFGFLTNTCTSPFSIGGKDAATGERTAATATEQVSNKDARVSKLQKQIDALKLKNADFTELEQDNDALRRQIVSKTKSYEKAEKALNTKIETLQNQLESSEQSKKTLQNQLATVPTAESSKLKNKNNELQSELEHTKTKIKALNEQLAAMKNATDNQQSKQLATLVEEQKAEIEKHLAKTTLLNDEIKKLKMAKSDNTNAEATAKSIATMKAQIDKLKNNLATLKTELAAKKAQISQLNAQVNQFKAQKTVFAKSADNLPKTAQTLFADLKALEGKSANEVKDAYAQINKKNNSEAKARIKFTSGSSDLSAQDKAKIAELTQAAGDNSYFLIVGYADKSGAAAANQKLSSERSISVAKELSSKAKGFQAAQAVYLGQTDRFGPPAENRVVEIWEIK